MLEQWGLASIPDLAADVEVIVSELVTNVRRHAADAYPWGRLTLGHTGERLELSVHGRNGDRHGPYTAMRHQVSGEAESGRGLSIVRELAAAHRGDVFIRPDWDGAGKFVRVSLPLPNGVRSTIASRCPFLP
ncbi:putative signal transduction histidine kinase [Streptantibioticus cattleyicolor NRRL 8057 = DSM 46488]|uniref:Putative signal transduction histidine kinase n=2 Tax=Kitasatosporales TaxID=85011 RepID=F8K0Q7_STREN|nr:ATP-binding protein [Streptomyces sp. SID5468]AEW94763.1 putative signal transduction histidine kinase [Streptantibioticus cattleyicolor NRRL 8057 = DSM 46488]MYS59390.1 ATP-binding protein [Streptomyces sp. SID5468]CCB75118.1 protein of unknown function [Streptantibioticus cattleyicolor NRRL 8057 = DSM 46488]